MAKPPRTGERLHKHLADLGVESRRTIERWIEQGKIKVNGRVAQLGDKVDSHSRITVDGRPLRSKPNPWPRQPRVILYNKPEGEISTRKDPGNRPTVFRHLPGLKGERWVAVGRLDINTRGLLLFTNDGELANRLMHPRFGMEREYLCRVYGRVNADSMQRLKAGVMLDRKRVRFEQVRRQRGQGDDGNPDGTRPRNSWYSVVVSEGKYREVRRMWEAVGCRLSRLIRVRYGDVILPKTLKPGQWQELKPTAISGLMSGPPSADEKNAGSVSSRKPRKREAQGGAEQKPSGTGRKNRVTPAASKKAQPTRRK